MPASADRWYEHYARAEEALQARDWTRAVAELNEAIARKGDSGARERSYGMRVVAYFPYLKLGVAYTELGQYEAAEQAFDTEERLGAIAASSEASDELGEYRRRAKAGRERLAADAARQAEAIAGVSLTEAESLERAGRLEEAMGAVGRALAVAPDSAEANARMARLREAVTGAERVRKDRERAASLVSEARGALAAGRVASAAVLLRQALTLAPAAETEGLLRQAEARLRAAQADEDAAGRPLVVADAISAARSFADAGRVDEALDRLQPVLAAEPGNTEAKGLVARLLVARRDAERAEEVRGALAEADVEHRAGRYERSLAAANRALALDAGSQAALDHVRQALAGISRQLLGRGRGEVVPPATRFAEARESQSDGSRVQVVHEPDFRLTGVVIDRTPVELAFLDEAGHELAATTSSQSVGDLVLTEFAVAMKLVPGPATVRVKATSTSGLSSEAEYAVRYDRPVLRSPWAMVVLVATPLAGAGVFLALKAARRRRLRRRKFNPFVAGAPVLDEKLFFGRERLIEGILQTVHNNSLLLHGERRIGKTSLLHQVRRRLEALDDPEFAFYPVFVDLQGTPEERFFATLGSEIAAELGPRLPPGTLREGVTRGNEYGNRELVDELRAVIAGLASRSSRHVKVVLLIDEVDELNAYDPRINQRLRSLFMRSFATHLVAVVSGVEIRREWEQHGSPWYNFFEEVEVTSIAPADAAALLKDPLEGVFTIDDDALQRVLALTGCKPYQVQKAGIALVNRLHELGRTRITLPDVDAVLGGGRP